MNQAATEQTPLIAPVAGQEEDNTQAKQRRRRLLRWGVISAGAIILIIITILILVFVPFGLTKDGVQVVPSKLVVKDSKVQIQLGVVSSGGGVVEADGEGEGKGRTMTEGGGGGLVSDVQIESTEVDAVTIYVLEAKVSRVDGGERVGVNHDITTDASGNNDKLVGHRGKEEEEEPALMVDRVSSSTGTFLNFFISSHPTLLSLPNNDDIKVQGQEHDGHGRQRQGRREENTTTTTTLAGRLRLRIEVPFGFTGELTIDGTRLNIKGSSSLADARFNLLHLTTEEGNITLGKSDNNNNNTSTSSWKRVTNPPTLQVSNLYVRVHRHGSVLIGIIGSPEIGKPIRANIETQKGDISFNALQTMITFDSEGEGRYPDPDETVHFFSLITHQGNVEMQLHEGESFFGPWYIRGLVMVLAQAKGGSVRGLVEIPDLQLLALDAMSDRETVLNVSEKFIGELTVRSSPKHQATVTPFPKSKHILRYTHSDRTLKRGKKVRAEGEFVPLGRLNVQASNGPANVTFV
ncbi:MAG: hypothetical protein J3R72DRAFT_432622 [Linnemannia gamsii]|nr:MAG: hypothetical protein J3R72DRAFT_432622 [Linnemannia gamsii]